MARSSKVTACIFVSYRRADAAGHAGRLYDRLIDRFSQDSVFMDVSGIDPGVDFAGAIEDAVRRCNVMVSVIGPNWPGSAEKGGRRRIDDPGDYVRLEIATALNRNIPVISVLVDGAARPVRETLPQDVAELAQTPAVELREGHWDDDIQSLLSAVDKTTLSQVGTLPSKRPAALIVSALTVILLLIGGWSILFPAVDYQPVPAVDHPPDSSSAVGQAQAVTVVKPVAILQARPIHALAALSGGRLASAFPQAIAVWDMARATATPLFRDAGEDALVLATLPAGRLAWGTQSGVIRIWDVPRKVLDATLTGHAGPVVALAQLKNDRLASGSWDGTVRLWNLSNGKLERTLEGHTNQVRALVALPEGRLASGSTDGTIIIWTLGAETEKVRTLDRRGSAINALVLMGEGRLAAGSEDGTIEVWNLATGKMEASIRAHQDGVNALAALGDGRVASASDDRTIGIWNPVKGTLDARLEGHSDRINALAVLPDGRLASGSEDGTICLWAVPHPHS